MATEDDEATTEALKASLWYAISKIVDEESLRLNVNATPQFVGALMEMVWMQIENTAIDLETFSRHAGRSTIMTDDVLLICRRNEALHDLMSEYIDSVGGREAQGKGQRRRGGGVGA